MIRLYQIYCGDHNSPYQAIFEGTVVDADNCYGLRIDATEEDLKLFCGDLERADKTKVTIRYRDFSCEVEREQYFRGPQQMFASILQ